LKLKSMGKKSELIERLLQHFAAELDEEKNTEEEAKEIKPTAKKTPPVIIEEEGFEVEEDKENSENTKNSKRTKQQAISEDEDKEEAEEDDFSVQIDLKEVGDITRELAEQIHPQMQVTSSAVHLIQKYIENVVRNIYMEYKAKTKGNAKMSIAEGKVFLSMFLFSFLFILIC